MKANRVSVRNYRCIKDGAIEVDSLTALIGRNGAGKSSFLRALKLFYTPSADIEEDDFFNGNVEEPIVVEVSFGGFTKLEKEEFGEYITNGEMRVVKEVQYEKGQIEEGYYGYKPKNPDFDEIRKGRLVEDRKEAYFDLYESGAFADLPEIGKSARGYEIEDALIEWEESHPEHLEMKKDDGSYFDKNAKISRRTKYIYVPAVREASEEASEGRGAAIAEIMDVVVRNTLSQHDDIVSLKKDTQQRYDKIVEEQSRQELKALGEKMSKTMNLFAPDTEISLDWKSRQSVEIEMPQASVNLVEDGYGADVQRAGHGAQRAFILTALQHLVSHQDDREIGDEDKMHLMLAIEEPELYQHPSRQRHLAKVLYQLAEKGVAGIAENVQIIFSTHSPLFINVGQFDNVRLLTKEQREED